jgi:hypothetical protein
MMFFWCQIVSDSVSQSIYQVGTKGLTSKCKIEPNNLIFRVTMIIAYNSLGGRQSISTFGGKLSRNRVWYNACPCLSAEGWKYIPSPDIEVSCCSPCPKLIMRWHENGFQQCEMSERCARNGSSLIVLDKICALRSLYFCIHLYVFSPTYRRFVDHLNIYASHAIQRSSRRDTCRVFKRQ